MFCIAGESGVRYGVTPSGGGEGPGEGGYAEWLHAMRLVARLPAGVPQHFRKKVRKLFTTQTAEVFSQIQENCYMPANLSQI